MTNSDQYKRCIACEALLLRSAFRSDPRYPPLNLSPRCKVCARQDPRNAEHRAQVARRNDAKVLNGLRAWLESVVVTDGRCRCGKVTRLYDGKCQACRQWSERRCRELAR